METLLMDLRTALRRLAKNPGFTAAAVLTLALGIGANTALFSVVRAVLLRPLPYGQPERVVTLWSHWKDFPRTWVSLQELEAYRREVKSFAEVGVFDVGHASVTGQGEPERVARALVSANVLGILGVRPVLGRGILPAEETSGRDRVALIGHALWQRRFAGDPGVVGRTVRVDGVPVTVVGVLPAGVRLPLDYETGTTSELWMPLVPDPADAAEPLPGSHSFYGLARLRPGATAAEASRELRAWARRQTAAGVYPRDWNFQASATPVAEDVAGRIRPALLVLLGAVALVLAIACANVANLLLVRGERQRQEVGVRRALGAGGGRLVRELLTESLLIAAAGGALGLLLADSGVRLAAALAPANLPRVAEAQVDARVLLFAIAASLLTAAVFGVLPAVQAARVAPGEALRDGGRTSTAGRGRERFRATLVLAEVAVALVLAVGAALMARTVGELLRIDPGFRPDDVLTLELTLPATAYPEPADASRFYAGLLGRVRELPGVESAGAVRLLPLATQMGDRGLTVEGYQAPDGEHPKGDWQVLTPGAFEALGMEVVEGRGITGADGEGAPPVMVVNETLARRYFGGRSPLGRRVRIGLDPARPWSTVVGVVRDLRHNDLTEPVKEQFYVAHAQFAASTGYTPATMTLVVRGRDPMSLARPVREQVREMDPTLPVARVRLLEDVVADSIAEPRFTMQLLLMFGALALLLAAVGIYGVVAFAVEARHHEVGVRMALGAQPRQMVLAMVRRGLAQAAAGVALGAVLALAAVRVLRGMLYGVGETDPLAFAGAALATVAVAALASWLPARRAARVDPAVTLRRG